MLLKKSNLFTKDDCGIFSKSNNACVVGYDNNDAQHMAKMLWPQTAWVVLCTLPFLLDVHYKCNYLLSCCKKVLNLKMRTCIIFTAHY